MTTHTRTYVYPRAFAGWRPNPPQEYQGKGITNSGETHDYEGVIFSDGTVVIRWMTAFRSRLAGFLCILPSGTI